MRTRTRLRSESAIFLVVLFGILIMVNILSVRFFARADLTENGLFTLSRASASLMERLEDRLVVKAYFTKNLPGGYASLERHVRDLLEEYAQHSGGKMSVEFLDPEGDELEEETAKNLGIQKMPNPDIEKDQATIKDGYRGIAFSYGPRTEVIAAVESPVGLEYQVTTVLKKVLGQKSNVGFLVGHGEPLIDPPSDSDRPLMPEEKANRGAFRSIRSNLEIYNYTQVDLKAGASDITPETHALVVVGPTAQLTEKELYRLDQFLLKGNSVAMFLSGVDVKIKQPEMPVLPPTYETAVNETGLRALLAHYGVELDSTLVLDKQASNYVSKCPPLPVPLPRPYQPWPVITSFAESPVTFRLGGITLPYATPVRLTDAARKSADLEATEIAFSSGASWTVDGEGAQVDPCAIVEPSILQTGIPVGATLAGTFKSYFDGRELPAGVAGAGQAGFIAQSERPGRLIVVGSAALPLDETLMYLSRIDRRMAGNNFTFVQNVLDWMTNEDDLIAVRMKNINDPPLEKGEEITRQMAKWGNIAGVPLLLVVFGIARWRVRASRRRAASGQQARG